LQIEVDMTFEQYIEATRLLCLHSTKKRRWNYIFIWYVYPIMGAVFAFVAAYFWISEKNFSTPVVINIATSVFLFWCRFSFPARARKLYEQQSSNFPGTMTLTSEGMRFERKNGTATTDYSWAAFETWLERAQMFLVFPGPLSFIQIPKDKLTSVEQNEVRTWISASSKYIP
jgi:hypothetical protein